MLKILYYLCWGNSLKQLFIVDLDVFVFFYKQPFFSMINS